MTILNQSDIDHAPEQALEALLSEVASGKIKPAQESEKSISSNVVRFFHNGNTATLVISNRTSQPATTSYIIRVLDGDDGRWKLHTQGQAIVQPNTDYQQGFHKWRAANWDAQWW